MRIRFSRIIPITIKELQQLKRDRRIYPLIFVAPLMQLIIFGYAATLDIKHVSLGVYDADSTYMSREYIRAFAYNGYFDLNYQVSKREELFKLLDKGDIKIGVYIQKGFQERLKKGKTAPVGVFVDGSNSNAATIGLNYVRIVSERFSSKLIISSIDLKSFHRNNFLGSWRKKIGKVLLVDDAIRIWYNPALESKNFFVPGVICMVLLIVTANFTSLSIVREKEIGTLEQLIVTPIRPSELIIGKLIPFIGLGFVDVSLIMFLGNKIFDVPIKGSISLLFLFSAFFLLTSLGLGILISTLVNTQEQSFIVAFFILIVMVTLSGIIFPISNMPIVIQYLTYLMSLRFFAEIVRGIFMKGVGAEVLWGQALALVALGIGILSLSIIRLKKRLE